MKIWWQSSRSFKEGPGGEAFRESLLEYLNSFKGKDVEITIGNVDQGSQHFGYNTVGVLTYAAPGGILNKIIRAEEQGYDGAVIGCYNDIGLREAREMCNFPVYGVFETSVHLACMLGDRFSGVAINEKQARLYGRIVREYGVKDKALPFAAINTSLEEVLRFVDQPGPLIKRFKEAAQKVASEGAEVIIPACGILNVVMAKDKIREIDGAVVLSDGYAVVLKFAEAMIRLYREIGLTTSKKLSYASPSKEHLSEIMSTYMFR